MTRRAHTVGIAVKKVEDPYDVIILMANAQ